MARAHPDHNMISSEQVEGTAVYDAKGDKVGEIDHLMIDKVSGQVRYAVMSFGGFLGLGHSHYPLPWGALKYDTGVDGYRADVSEQMLKNAPEFSDDTMFESADRDWESRTHAHYRVDPYWNQRGTGSSTGTPRV